MKETKKTNSGKNYDSVQLGKLDGIKDYTLRFSPDVVIPGKVFVGQRLGTTGAELSFQSFAPGQDSGFLHAHKNHEELYFILKGEGVYQVDGEVFPVSEGSVVRVSPEGKRAMKNTGKDELLMLCVQYKGNSFDAQDLTDGIILDEPLHW